MRTVSCMVYIGIHCIMYIMKLKKEILQPVHATASRQHTHTHTHTHTRTRPRACVCTCTELVHSQMLVAVLEWRLSKAVGWTSCSGRTLLPFDTVSMRIKIETVHWNRLQSRFNGCVVFSDRLTWVIKAQQPHEQRYPVLSEWVVFSCVQTMVWLSSVWDS